MEDHPSGTSERRGVYGVKLVRGPFLKLPPNPDHCRSEDELTRLVQSIRCGDPEALLAADLFSGGGGLSLGLEQAGFKVVLSVDHFTEAVETHSHYFPGLSVDWDLGDADRIEQVAALIRGNSIDLLAGGPPCQPFSKAGRSKIRYRVQHHQRDPHDERRDLWRSFMEVVRLARPRAVVMENVPDMALDKEMFILRAMVEELESLGYGVEERLIDTWRYGVPQFRQRLILVAVHDGGHFAWPDESEERVSVWNAIGELPEVEGGWRPDGGADGWTAYDEPTSTFQKAMRTGVTTADSHKLFDHITRPVRPDDAVAFAAMDARTKYSDLPAEVKRYRDDIFDDKYKRLGEDDLSRTITAHIAKDGYWYIHPRQDRTLTVREAARLQTFPDWYRFAGPPSAAFRQIGNAVPPLLARRLGAAVRTALVEKEPAAMTTQATARALATWFRDRRSDARRMALPWLSSLTRWQVMCAELLLDRAENEQVRLLWPLIEVWSSPEATLAQESAVSGVGRAMGRSHRVDRLIELARWFVSRPEDLDRLDPKESPVPGLHESVADLARLVVPVTAPLDRTGPTVVVSDEPVLVIKGVLRVASRFLDERVDTRNRLTDGRMAIARMIGGGADARDAHLGLIELAAAVCRPVDPKCSVCPLASVCASSAADEQRRSHLFHLPA